MAAARGTLLTPRPRARSQSCVSPAPGQGPSWNGVQGTGKGGCPITFPVPSRDAENRAHHGGLSSGASVLLAETPVGQRQPPCHHQVSGWWVRSQHKPHWATRGLKWGLGEGTWGSCGWDLPQLPLTLAKASAARGGWHESPWMGAAPRDWLPAPPLRSFPTNPPLMGACPRDQAVHGGWVTLTRAGELRDRGQGLRCPLCSPAAGFGVWRRWGVARGGQARHGQGTHAGYSPARAPAALTRRGNEGPTQNLPQHFCFPPPLPVLRRGAAAAAKPAAPPGEPGTGAAPPFPAAAGPCRHLLCPRSPAQGQARDAGQLLRDGGEPG